MHVDNSSELSNKVAEKMQEKFLDIKYVKIKESGHNFHLERPKKTSKEIINFVENNWFIPLLEREIIGLPKA